MVLQSVRDALNTAKEDVKDGASNYSEALRTGSSDNIDLERRHTIELTIGAGATYLAGSNHLAGKSANFVGENTPNIKWQIGPFGNIDQENNVNEEVTPTEDDWTSEYNVDNFVDDLYDQGDVSVAATDEFFMDAYRDGGNEINRSGVDNDTLVVNRLGADMYDTEPGLGYSQEFGETLKALDNEDELEGVVEGYVEQELV